DRLGVALAALYGWDRSKEALRTNLLPDLAGVASAIRKAIEGYQATFAEVADAGWAHRSRLRRAAIGHAVAFDTWRSLAHEGLTDTEAARLIIGLIAAADRQEPGTFRSTAAQTIPIQPPIRQSQGARGLVKC